MPIPKPPEEQPTDYPGSSEDASEHEDDIVARETSGSGLSVALSVAFYVIVLAAGISYDHAHRLRSPPSGTPDMYDADSALMYASASALPAMLVSAAGSEQVLQARVRDCALKGQWNCVGQATQDAIALRNDTPESQALLDEGTVDGTWTLANTLPAEEPRPEYGNRYGHLKVSVRAEDTWDRWHLHRHSAVARLGRRGALTRHASPEYIADLYRH
jgi:hypothetical protein